MTDSEPCEDLFQALYDVARTVNSSLDTMQVLQTIVTSTATALGVKACSVRLLGPDGKHLMFGAAHGLSSNYRAKGLVLVEQSGIDREALAGATPVFVADARCDARFQYPDQAREEGIASVLVAPLRVQEQPIGVMRIYTAAPRTFGARELALAEAIASLSALAIENGRLYERLHRNYQAAIEFDQREFE